MLYLNLFESSTYNFFESFTFAITASVITLVGLIVIYLSINVQHAIQRSRELYWEIIGYTYEEQDERYFKEIRGKVRKNIELYKHTLTLNLLNKLVVLIAIISIVTVLIIWWHYFFYISKMNVNRLQLVYAEWYLIAITIILMLFSVILYIITKPYLLGNLKKVENMLDGTKKTELTTISIAAYSIELLIIVDYGYLQIVPRFPFKISNIKIQSSVRLYIPDAEPYPKDKYISDYVWEGEMIIKNDIDGRSDLYGYDIKFNSTGEIKDNEYIHQQCTVPNLGARNGSLVYIILTIISDEGRLEVLFPEFIIKDIYGTIDHLKPISIGVPFEIIEN